MKSGKQVLLDSVILIDHFNGIQKATDYIKEVATISHISAITRAEVLTGFKNPLHLQKARDLLDRFPLIVIDSSVADLAAELGREYKWTLPDAIQAASARKNGLFFITRNVKDFPPNRFDFVRIPYKI